MKYLGKRNLSDCKLWYLYTILGYNVFIPDSYASYLTFLRKGCPIWICSETNGECVVFECDTDNQDITYEKIVGIIKTFPIRKGYYCFSMYPDSLNGIPKTENVILSFGCNDETNHMQAAIVICEDSDLAQKEKIPCGKIVYLQNNDIKALTALSKFAFKEYTINLFRSLLIYYKAQSDIEEENAKQIGMIKMDDGLYYYQFE